MCARPRSSPACVHELHEQPGCRVKVAVCAWALSFRWDYFIFEPWLQRNTDLIPVACLSLKPMALHCRLKWRYSSRDRSGQLLPKLNPKQSLERLQSQLQWSGPKMKAWSRALFLRSCKAALEWHSASLWAPGTLPRESVYLSREGALMQYSQPVLFILFKAGIVVNEASMNIHWCLWILQKMCQTEPSETW